MLTGLALRCRQQVVEECHFWEWPGDLERPAHAARHAAMGFLAGDPGAFQKNLAAAWHEAAGDHVEQRGLARTIGTDEAGDLACRNAKRDARHRRGAAEPLAHRANFEHAPSLRRHAAVIIHARSSPAPA